MAALQAIWLVSLLLAAASMIWMVGLTLARVVRTRFDRRRAKMRSTVLNLYLRIMNGDSEAISDVAAFRRNPALLTSVLLQFTDLIRGGSRDHLIRTLSAIGIEEMLRRHALHGSGGNRLAAD